MGNPSREPIHALIQIRRYFVIATIYLVVKNSSWVLAQDRTDHRQLYQGELFMMFVWPVLITYGIWILAPLTLLRRPHQWWSVSKSFLDP